MFCSCFVFVVFLFEKLSCLSLLLFCVFKLLLKFVLTPETLWTIVEYFDFVFEIFVPKNIKKLIVLELLRLWEHAKTFFHTQKMLISWFKVDAGAKNDIGGEFKVTKKSTLHPHLNGNRQMEPSWKPPRPIQVPVQAGHFGHFGPLGPRPERSRGPEAVGPLGPRPERPRGP